MDKVVLKANKRAVTGKQVHAVRRAGQLPGVVYGRHTDPVAIVMDGREASRVLSQVSSSSLVTIQLDGREFPALVREKQRNFIKGTLLHVDFLAVDMSERIRATVGIEFTGMSLAVKDFNAVLVTGMDKLEIECLPGDLPEKVTVDISTLNKIGDSIHVRDIVISDKIKVLTSIDDMIINATAPKVEEVVEAPVAEAEVVAGEPELAVERGKKEDELAEEGTGKKGEAKKGEEGAGKKGEAKKPEGKKPEEAGKK
jgi:large subunit ribosomal protein L25